jgi:hypothetical protein
MTNIKGLTYAFNLLRNNYRLLNIEVLEGNNEIANKFKVNNIINMKMRSINNNHEIICDNKTINNTTIQYATSPKDLKSLVDDLPIKTTTTPIYGFHQLFDSNKKQFILVKVKVPVGSILVIPEIEFPRGWMPIYPARTNQMIIETIIETPLDSYYNPGQIKYICDGKTIHRSFCNPDASNYQISDLILRHPTDNNNIRYDPGLKQILI